MIFELEFGDVGFCGGRKTAEPREKPSEQGESQHQTQPKHGRNRAWATLVGGERYRYYTIPAPQTGRENFQFGLGE